MRSIELSEPHTVLCEVLAIFADVYKLGTYAMLSVWCSILLLCARATQVQELEFRSRQGPLGPGPLRKLHLCSKGNGLCSGASWGGARHSILFASSPMAHTDYCASPNSVTESGSYGQCKRIHMICCRRGAHGGHAVCDGSAAPVAR